MPLDAGSVIVRLGALLSKTGFDDWDRKTTAVRAEANTPINQKLGADTTRFDAAMAGSVSKLSVFGGSKAVASLDADDTKAMIKIGGAQAAVDKFGSEQVMATLGIDTTDALTKYAELDALRKKWASTKATATFDIDTAAAQAKIAEIEAEMLKLRSSAEMPMIMPGGGGRGPRIPRIPSGGGGGSGGSKDGEEDAKNYAKSFFGTLGHLLHAKGGFHGLGGFSLGSIIGLGPEHLLTAAASTAGALGTGLIGGGGVAAVGMAGKELVGGGADYLVSHETDANVKAVSAAQQTLNMAISTYGKNSTQAAAAQAKYNGTLDQLAQKTGPGAAKAEAGLASSISDLESRFEKATSGAQEMNAEIKTQMIGVADAYTKNIGTFTKGNLDIADKTLKPFFTWLKGPDAMGLIKQLEDDFQRGIPNSLGAATSGFKVLMQVAVDAEKHGGGFMKHLDEYLTKLADDPAKIQSFVSRMLNDLHTVDDFLKALFGDIMDFLHDGNHDGNQLLQYFTGILDKTGEWEKSAAGSSAIKSFMAERIKELIAILGMLRPIGNLFFRFYGALQPLVPVVTAIANGIADLLKGVLDIGKQSSVFNLVFVAPIGAALLSMKLLGKETTVNALNFLGMGKAIDAVKSKASSLVAMMTGGRFGSFASSAEKEATQAGASDEAVAAARADTTSGGGFTALTKSLTTGITGIKGMGVGSEVNPMAVVVIAGDRVGMQGMTPKGLGETADEAEGGAVSTEESAGGALVRTAETDAPEALGAASLAPVAEEAGGIAGGLGAAGLIGISAAAAVGIGSAVVGALNKLGIFKSGPGRTTRESSYLTDPSTKTTYGTGVDTGLAATRTSQSTFRTDIKSELDQFYKDTSKTMTEVGPRGASEQYTVHIAPDLDTAAGQQAAAMAEKMGEQIGGQMVAGWSSAKFGNEQTMFGELDKTLSDPSLPEGAKAAAAKTVIAYAQGLQDKGDLAGGSADKLVKQVESKFPALTQYLGGTTAPAITAALTTGINSNKIIQGTTNLISNIAKAWSILPPQLDASGTTISDQWTTLFDTLETNTTSGSAKIRSAALSSMKQMVSDATSILPQIPKIASTQSEATKVTIASNLGAAAVALQQNMTKMGVNTKTGMAQVSALTSAELSLLGAKPLGQEKTILTKAGAGATGGALRAIMGRTKNYRFEGGGYLPGSEFGLGDHMTLVDPTGMPRALMAGDESIFTRHQMPDIEHALSVTKALGLGDYGSSSELWGGINRPHGYARGGDLPGYAVGGALGEINSFFGSHGYNKMAISGIEGNAMQESSLNWNEPGGGMWQQITNFGQGTGGSPLNQMTKMLSQIGNLKGALNAASSPGAAAQIFEQGFEHAGTPAMANRIRYAQEAFAGTLSSGSSSGGAGVVWTNIKAPHISGVGGLTAIAQGSVNKATAAANAYGMAQVASMNATSGSGGTGDAPGTIIAHGGKPAQVEAAMMQAAHQIMGLPYKWGGGHGSFSDDGYDCSGAVSYLLHAAGFTNVPMATPQLATWGDPGPGKYITVGDSLLRGHSMISFFGKYLESGGGGPYGANDVHWDPGWDGNFEIPRHPTGFARGGRLGIPKRYAGGGTLNQVAGGVSRQTGDFGEMSPSYLLRDYPALANNTAFERYEKKWMPRFAGGGVLPAFAKGGTGIKAKKPKIAATHTPPHSASLLSTVSGAANIPGMKPFVKIANQFISDDKKAATLQNTYTQEQQLYSLYDTGSTGYLPTQDLQNLMGTQTSQWDLYWNEYGELPAAIAKLKTMAGTLLGSTGYTRKLTPTEPTYGNTTSTKGAHGPTSLVVAGSGIDMILKELNANSTQVTGLQADLTKLSTSAATDQHKISAAARAAALMYAGQLNSLLGEQLTTQQSATATTYNIAQLTNKLATASGSNYGNIQKQIRDLQQGREAQMLNNPLSAKMQSLRTAQSAAATKYSNEGFDRAWSDALKKNNVQAVIAKIQAQDKLLQELLAAEQKRLAFIVGSGDVGSVTGGGKKGTDPLYGKVNDPTGGLLQELEYRYGGSPDGSVTSVADTLETIGYNIVDLVQQGATVKPSIIQQIGELFNKEGVALPEGWSLSGASTGGAGGVAALAMAELQNFQAGLANIFQSYGSNFAAAGSTPFSSATGQLAGTQYYGAPTGPSVGASPNTGGTTVNITQNFASGPSNPHSYAAGLNNELTALV